MFKLRNLSFPNLSFRSLRPPCSSHIGADLSWLICFLLEAIGRIAKIPHDTVKARGSLSATIEPAIRSAVSTPLSKIVLNELEFVNPDF